MANYEKLAEWLNNPQRLLMTFKEIENIIGESLPESALKYMAWWQNETGSRHAQVWLEAGWEVEHVDMQAEEVTFRRKVPSA